MGSNKTTERNGNSLHQGIQQQRRPRKIASCSDFRYPTATQTAQDCQLLGIPGSEKNTKGTGTKQHPTTLQN
ncbi:hypothetical protein QE152_g4409 [Popillia japonica]|uniref:Uncharacterized protein n=1 Tax=Popillia japonica TaxID=7064 RepID=A0AAW1N2I7_POPJA